jgi:macrophage erythroblast attacher
LQQLRLQETTVIKKTGKRLEYLNQLMDIKSVESEEFDRWSKIRLNHLVVDYLARQGLNQSATKLAHEAQIEDLVDLDLFVQTRKVIDSLLNRSCVEALQWCLENKSALKKMKSSLEFQLRLQEYIELVKDRQFGPAIVYLKKHLISWSDTHLKEIQQASGLLAFTRSTPCSQYKVCIY